MTIESRLHKRQFIPEGQRKPPSFPKFLKKDHCPRSFVFDGGFPYNMIQCLSSVNHKHPNEDLQDTYNNCRIEKEEEKKNTKNQCGYIHSHSKKMNHLSFPSNVVQQTRRAVSLCHEDDAPSTTTTTMNLKNFIPRAALRNYQIESPCPYFRQEQQRINCPHSMDSCSNLGGVIHIRTKKFMKYNNPQSSTFTLQRRHEEEEEFSHKEDDKNWGNSQVLKKPRREAPPSPSFVRNPTSRNSSQFHIFGQQKGFSTFTEEQDSQSSSNNNKNNDIMGTYIASLKHRGNLVSDYVSLNTKKEFSKSNKRKHSTSMTDDPNNSTPILRKRRPQRRFSTDCCPFLFQNQYSSSPSKSKSKTATLNDDDGTQYITHSSCPNSKAILTHNNGASTSTMTSSSLYQLAYNNHNNANKPKPTKSHHTTTTRSGDFLLFPLNKHGQIPQTTNVPRVVEGLNVKTRERLYLFESCSEASRQMNINRTRMSRTCRAGGGAINGIFFQYAEMGNNSCFQHNLFLQKMNSSCSSSGSTTEPMSMLSSSSTLLSSLSSSSMSTSTSTTTTMMTTMTDGSSTSCPNVQKQDHTSLVDIDPYVIAAASALLKL